MFKLKLKCDSMVNTSPNYQKYVGMDMNSPHVGTNFNWNIKFKKKKMNASVIMHVPILHVFLL